MRFPIPLLGLSLAALFTLGCQGDGAAPRCAPGSTCGDGATPGGDQDGFGDLGSPGGGAVTNTSLQDYCSGKGPPILIGGDAEETCTGSLAATTFRYALCTCDEYAGSFTLATDSFDSSQGAYTSGDDGASVGINGRLSTNGDMTLGGSLWVGSSHGIQAGGGDILVSGALHAAGPLTSGVRVEIGHDAFVAGSVRAGALAVGGTLTLPAGASASASTTSLGGVAHAPVHVDPPCACGDDDLVDIAGFVDHHRASNDNATLPLEPRALAAYAGATVLELPCGRYYLEKIAGQGDLTIRIAGRTALFVGGDVAPGGRLKVEVGPEGELDLFVKGAIVSSVPVELGSPDAPAKVRVYMAGAGNLTLSASSTFGGNVYAPRAQLFTSGSAEIFGALFVKRLAASNALSIHYDTAILEEGGPCDPPGDEPSGPCGSCLDCGGQACIEGVCDTCSTNDDCCAPLVCEGGQCVPEIR